MKIKFFHLARKVSLKSTEQFRISAVVVDKQKNVINIGSNNMTKTHSKSLNRKHPFIHAELDALAGLSEEQTRGGSIYVYRETRDGKVAQSKPCGHCKELIRRYGIKFVYYTDYDGYKGYKVA